MLRLLANARRSIQFVGRHLFSSFGNGRAHPSENSAGMLTGMYEAGPSPERRGSAFFVRADGQRKLAPDLAPHAKRGRGDEERRKAAANTLRRKSIKPWPIAWA